MFTDEMLIDWIRDAFGYETDVQVAGFLGVNKNTISAIRHKRTAIGESLRFSLLEKLFILDKLAYRKAEDFILRARSVEDWRKAQARSRQPLVTSVFSPKSLAAKILDARRNQHDRWALKEIEAGPAAIEDAQLLDLYKEYKGFNTDEELAKTLGIKRNSISTIRYGRSGLGPLSRLRIYRDVYGTDTTDLESALESSEAMLKLLRRITFEQNAPSDTAISQSNCHASGEQHPRS